MDLVMGTDSALDISGLDEVLPNEVDYDSEGDTVDRPYHPTYDNRGHYIYNKNNPATPDRVEAGDDVQLRGSRDFKGEKEQAGKYEFEL